MRLNESFPQKIRHAWKRLHVRRLRRKSKRAVIEEVQGKKADPLYPTRSREGFDLWQEL